MTALTVHYHARSQGIRITADVLPMSGAPCLPRLRGAIRYTLTGGTTATRGAVAATLAAELPGSDVRVSYPSGRTDVYVIRETS